jgi:hypothetical protein
MMHGFAARARRKTSRMARSDSPTYILISSDPFTAKKFWLDSVAIAWAIKVLAQPGGPYKSTPLRFWGPPNLMSRSGTCSP